MLAEGSFFYKQDAIAKEIRHFFEEVRQDIGLLK